MTRIPSGILLVSIAPVLIGSIELASVVGSMGHGINNVMLLLVVTVLAPSWHIETVVHWGDCRVERIHIVRRSLKSVPSLNWQVTLKRTGYVLSNVHRVVVITDEGGELQRHA